MKPCTCSCCARRAAMTPEQRAAFDADDRREEALELEFVGGLFDPIATAFPQPRRVRVRVRARMRRDPRVKLTRLEQQIATARRRLARRGIYVEAA